MLDQLERPGSVGPDAEFAALFRIEHGEGIVEQVLGNRELRGLGVEPKSMAVELLDRVGVPEPHRHLGVAVLVLLPAVELLEHVALHQAEHRRARRRIEAVLDVPDHVIGREVPAVVPFHALTDLQGPGLDVLARFPGLEQIGPGDVVVAGLGQILDHLPRHVALFDPGESVRGDDLLGTHADAQPAPFRQRGASRSHEGLARHLGGEPVGGRRRQAEQRRAAQELAAADPPFGELLPQPRQIGVFLLVRHPCLPSAPCAGRHCLDRFHKRGRAD